MASPTKLTGSGVSITDSVNGLTATGAVTNAGNNINFPPLPPPAPIGLVGTTYEWNALLNTYVSVGGLITIYIKFFDDGTWVSVVKNAAGATIATSNGTYI